MMKNNTLIAFSISMALIASLPQNSLCCSLIKITKHGKTIVGNNEDYYNPNVRIWFEKGKNGKYGAAYVGFENLYPQGGMNEAGLVFDGFTTSYKEVRDTVGKKKISPLDLEKKIMQECSNVDEVKKLIIQYNISFWGGGVLLFIDKYGKYLYVDGDNIFTEQQDTFIQTNNRYKENLDDWRFDKAEKLLSNYQEPSINYCKSVMDSIHQDINRGACTQYTTIYDPNEGLISLYYFYDFTHEIKFNIREELKREDRVLIIPELFTKNELGQKYFTNYNTIISSIKSYADNQRDNEANSLSVIKDSVDNSIILKIIWLFEIKEIGDSYLQNKEYQRAISYYKINVELFPEIWSVYDNLGTAYMENNENQLALKHLVKSVEINPNNSHGKNLLKKIQEQDKK